MPTAKPSARRQKAADCRGQIGALCWRMHRAKVEVLLITSRDTGRWVIPKGWPMEGLSEAEAAAIEAWEEAGVRGDINADSIGSFVYDKVISPNEVIPCTVAVFALRVAALHTDFPERKQRRRKWFSAGKAAGKVAEPELRQLLKAASKQLVTPALASD
jgi:8-oxo-dGTP pyrophosphatase MutT (NUDIX family)